MQPADAVGLCWGCTGRDRHAVRDSKDPEGAFLIVTRGAWSGLVSEIKQGNYDL
ncbi:DUF397 domain-containing protein [Actinomadura miaoliensis]|uniref:DUF397 domain-containing protein n=1 Tax=Actinomadura miaoliensis TaxID=430685 RepID=UPI003CD09C2A